MSDKQETPMEEGKAVDVARHEQMWKHRFVVKYAELLRAGGWDGSEEDLLDVAYQSANGAWGGGGAVIAEEAAQDEYEAMKDSA